MVTIDSLQELTNILRNGTITDPPPMMYQHSIPGHDIKEPGRLFDERHRELMKLSHHFGTRY